MRKWKQALALVLALVMALSLVALPSFAEGEGDGGGTAATQPVWPAEGSIKLDKDAKAVVGQENLWEVTLGIQGKNYSTTSDVVLVIDCSGSMEEGTKLEATRTAAKAFGDKLLTEGSTTRIAIVTYAYEAAAYSDGHFYMAAERSAFESAVDQATGASGATNQQAGIHVAQQLLASDSSTGKQKNIVILSDGEPTYSYPFVGGNASIDCKRIIAHWFSGNPQVSSWPTTATPDYSTVVGSGNSFGLDGNILWHCTCRHNRTTDKLYGSFYYDSNGNFVCSNGSKSSDNGVATIWEANQAKTAGTTIFSVALQANTNGENTLKSCATDAAKGYFSIGRNDNVEQKLTSAFEAIAGSIAIAASNGSVADTMGDEVQLSFSGAAPVITNDKAVYDAGNADVYISQGSATYDADARRINWTVGNVREGDNPIMKYKVTVKEGYNPHTGEVLDANKSATFSYKNYLGEDTVGTFPVPQVTVGGGNILVHYYLVNGQGQPINENGAVVESPALAEQVKPAAYHEVDGSTGLSYNIPYTVSHDNVADYNYYGSYILNDSNLTKGDSVDVTLTAANSNQHVWFAYYQTFNVVHVRMDENGAAKTVQTDTYTVSSGFNLTDKVTSGYLYGGAFQNAACTTAYPFAEGETGLSFTPKAGETYYIWEVPNAYLVPKTLAGWEHNQDNKLDVIAFYMMAGIDREYYAGVGFTVNGEDKLSNQNTLIDYSTGDNQGSTKVVSLTPGQSAGFQSVELKRKDGNTQTYTVTNVVPGYDKGFIACYGLAQADWKIPDHATTYTPYWITLDGVKVTSGVTRTATYQGVGYQRLATNNTGDAGKPVYAKNTQTATRLITFASYLADSTPIAQETPTVENVTVTVRDSNKTTQVEIPCGTSARDQISYQAPVGKVFAGWFTDEACTTPANLDSITQDTTIYAKYVSDSYLDLHYVRNGLFRLRGVTLISAVDNPANYQESGIIVDGEKLPVAYANRYMLLNTPASLFGAARNAKLMIARQSLSGSGTLEVTPYWVTKDGTTVLGENHTLHYNTRTVWE